MLADFPELPFAQAERVRLEELRLAAVADRASAELALGHHATVAAELEGLVAIHPFRESLHGLRMVALYRSGRQAEALQAYQSASRCCARSSASTPARNCSGSKGRSCGNQRSWTGRRRAR